MSCDNDSDFHWKFELIKKKTDFIRKKEYISACFNMYYERTKNNGKVIVFLIFRIKK